MPQPAAQSAYTAPAYIEHGKVVDVDVEQYTVSVYSEFTAKTLFGLSFAVPYQHFANGEGIYFMPEVGSPCWIAFPSDAMRPFVIAWAPAIDQAGSHAASRPALNPGDIYLGTRDDNFLILRRGGVVQIGGGPLSQRMFLPINNTIRDFCENYSLNTVGGSLDWTVLREENSVDGKRPAILRLAARQYADDEYPIALLEVGSAEAPNPPIVSSHSADRQNILSLTVNASGAAGAAKRISLNFGASGSAVWDFQDSVTMHVAADLTVAADGALHLTGVDNATLDGGTVEVSSDRGAVSVRSQTSVDVLARTRVSLGPRVEVGGGATPVLLATSAFINFIIAHTHYSGRPGQPTTPPIQTALLSSQSHISKTLFGK